MARARKNRRKSTSGTKLGGDGAATQTVLEQAEVLSAGWAV